MKTSTFNLIDYGLSLDKMQVGDAGFVGKIGQLAAAASTASTTSAATSANMAQPESSLVSRLMEIGFIPGESLQVLHKGFFGGGPIAVRIGQSTFALRRFEAALISVIPCKKKPRQR